MFNVVNQDLYHDDIQKYGCESNGYPGITRDNLRFQRCSSRLEAVNHTYIRLHKFFGMFQIVKCKNVHSMFDISLIGGKINNDIFVTSIGLWELVADMRYCLVLPTMDCNLTVLCSCLSNGPLLSVSALYLNPLPKHSKKNPFLLSLPYLYQFPTYHR